MHPVVKPHHLEVALDYWKYRKLMYDLLLEDRTSGPIQTPELLDYTNLNERRMDRLDKWVEIEPDLSIKVSEIDKHWIWLILSETWCGDVAQTLPVIHKIASKNSNIEVKLLFRDEHPEIMDAYTTNESRSIPKLICLQNDSMQELGVWGPRPAPAQKNDDGSQGQSKRNG